MIIKSKQRYNKMKLQTQQQKKKYCTIIELLENLFSDFFLGWWHAIERNDRGLC